MKKQEKSSVGQCSAEHERPRGRREVLKVGGLGALAAWAGAGKTLASGGTANRQKRYAMVIDVRRCIGCHACSVACKSEFGVPLGVWRSWVKQIERGKFPNTQRHFLPRLCNHCEHPPCVEACPTKSAYQREDGANLVREERCIGCRLCVAACPYNARFSHPDKKIADKCTFCVHRVDKGLVPACVNTCQGKARIFGDLNDPESEVAKLVAREAIQVLKPELGTEPRVFYIASDTGVAGRIGKEV
ncbi:MAG: sulfate reduction electron transfer complex DsrMKJOP subunit DsrO [Planctomycetota bacterium]|jgi:tetrathionate reductase subunit B